MWHEYRLASRKAVICCWLIHRPVFDAHRHHEIIPTSFMSVMPIDYTLYLVRTVGLQSSLPES